MGWNRLQQSSAPGETSEQDIAIITWFEILSDAGIPVESYAACYRSAQQRKSESMAQGGESRIITPNDLAVEWTKVRQMHAEIDKSRLLPTNAAAACQRCFGTGREEMPDGSSKPDCDHSPLTTEEIEERAAAKARHVEFMREAMKQVRPARPEPREVTQKPKGQLLRCSNPDCGREVNALGGYEIAQVCKDLIKVEGQPMFRCLGTFMPTGQTAYLG
jgi:hypothetical protein